MRTKSKLTLTHLIIEKRNLEEMQILKTTIKIPHSSCKSFIKLTYADVSSFVITAQFHVFIGF